MGEAIMTPVMVSLLEPYLVYSLSDHEVPRLPGERVTRVQSLSIIAEASNALAFEFTTFANNTFQLHYSGAYMVQYAVIAERKD